MDYWEYLPEVIAGVSWIVILADWFPEILKLIFWKTYKPRKIVIGSFFILYLIYYYGAIG